MGRFDPAGCRHGLHFMLLSVPKVDITCCCIGGSGNSELCPMAGQVFCKGYLGLTCIYGAVIMTSNHLYELFHIIKPCQVTQCLHGLTAHFSLIAV